MVLQRWLPAAALCHVAAAQCEEQGESECTETCEGVEVTDGAIGKQGG